MARVDFGKLLGEKAPAPHFEFGFATMQQSFSVSIEGLLAADTSDIARQRLSGQLVTADVESDAGIEQVLAAAQDGRPLEIAWDHHADRRTHAFVVQGVVRQDAPSALMLRWDGTPIGVEEASASEIAVPTLDTFAVSQARAVQGQEQYIELRFTDPLLPNQNLRGLVGIGNRTDLRLAVQGNIVEVYATAGFSGEQTLRVEAGVRNSLGYRMKERQELSVRFEQQKPQLRFASDGVIVPTSANLTVPIEAVNLRAVSVEAIRVAESNLPQFLQVNDLDGRRQMNRVGRVVWRKTLRLETTADKTDRWMSVGLDLSPLVQESPGGLYRLSLSFDRRHVVWPCGDERQDEPLTSTEQTADGEQEASYWDSWSYDADDWQSRYQGRHDPCNAGYYQRFYDHDIRASRNVLVSDVGLAAKAGQDGNVLVIATDLRTTAPLVGADVALRDYQHQQLASAVTDSDGIARLAVERSPFLAVVKSGSQTGYLRLDDGSALSMAHFDVSGSRSQKGLKGFLYGERGVWRPGDTMHLTFILHDPARRVGDEHPILFELLNPRGQVVKTITRAGSTDGFSTFEVSTPASAPTGNYIGRVSVGGAVFQKTLKVETVMPNRLKLALDFGRPWLRAGETLAGDLSSAWLHGAPARNLKAQVEVGLRTRGTRFERFGELFERA